MSYKHTPRHWYRPTYEEELGAVMTTEREKNRLQAERVLGMHEMAMGDHYTIEPKDSLKDRPEFVGWYAYEEIGVPILGTRRKEIPITEDLHIGQCLFITGLWGELYRATVSAASDDRRTFEARTPNLLFKIEHAVHAGVWVCGQIINTRSIVKLELVK